MAGMLGKLWDDVAGGSAPDQGLNQLRKSTSGNSRQFPDVSSDTLRNRERRFSTGTYDSPEGSPASQNIAISKSPNVGTLDVNEPVSGSPGSLGSTPPTSPFMAGSPSSGSPSSTYSREKDNVWRSVFHPGQHTEMRKIGSNKFDKAQENAPTVYDWMYSNETKSEYR